MDALNLLTMLFWLAELSISSWILSYGAEHLSIRYGAKFVGRTLLSVATTLPEIAIVIYASSVGLYDVAIGSGLGSNILMMTLGLALMLLISTTRLSKSPLKKIDVSAFKSDKLFLLVSAVLSAILLIDGYSYIDGFIFIGIFVGYILVAFIEMKKENKVKTKSSKTNTSSIDDASYYDITHLPSDLPASSSSSSSSSSYSKPNPSVDSLWKKRSGFIKAIVAFAIGTIGILIGASPFISSLQHFSIDIGVSPVVLAVIISPIAGEMPEKISMMILARKGAAGTSIAIANVLGSKILNNSLLLGIAIFAAMFHGGFFTIIPNSAILSFQMILATSITLISLVPLFRQSIGIKVGVLLLVMYIISIAIQFYSPGEVKIH
ncbi:MAG: sodium:calcium antiporter [Candidatus Nitrosocosmicus sp.]